MKCPICDNEVKEYSNDYMEHILCEEYAKCGDKHHNYNYQYAYGSTEETIGRVTFFSHYADLKDLRKLNNKQYKAVLELEREFYRLSRNI